MHTCQTSPSLGGVDFPDELVLERDLLDLELSLSELLERRFFFFLLDFLPFLPCVLDLRDSSRPLSPLFRANNWLTATSKLSVLLSFVTPALLPLGLQLRPSRRHLLEPAEHCP